MARDNKRLDVYSRKISTGSDLIEKCTFISVRKCSLFSSNSGNSARHNSRSFYFEFQPSKPLPANEASLDERNNCSFSLSPSLSLSPSFQITHITYVGKHALRTSRIRRRKKLRGAISHATWKNTQYVPSEGIRRACVHKNIRLARFQR